MNLAEILLKNYQKLLCSFLRNVKFLNLLNSDLLNVEVLDNIVFSTLFSLEHYASLLEVVQKNSFTIF